MSGQDTNPTPEQKREIDLQNKQFFWWVKRFTSPQAFIIYALLAWAYWAVTVRFEIAHGTPLFFAVWISTAVFIVLFERWIFRVWPMEPMPRANGVVVSLVKAQPAVESRAVSTPEEANALIAEGWVLASVSLDPASQVQRCLLHFQPPRKVVN